MTDISGLTADELCARMMSERNRVHGPRLFKVWYDRGWFRTTNGDAYRRSEIEQFINRFAAKPDWDGKPEVEEVGPGLGLFGPKI